MTGTTIPAAKTLCDDCAAEFEGTHTATGADSYLAVYCEHNKVGGLFLPALGQWRLTGPIEHDAFQALVARTMHAAKR